MEETCLFVRPCLGVWASGSVSPSLRFSVLLPVHVPARVVPQMIEPSDCMQDVAKEIPLMELFVRCGSALMHAYQRDETTAAVESSLNALIRKIPFPTLDVGGLSLDGLKFLSGSRAACAIHTNGKVGGRRGTIIVDFPIIVPSKRQVTGKSGILEYINTQSTGVLFSEVSFDITVSLLL